VTGGTYEAGTVDVAGDGTGVVVAIGITRGGTGIVFGLSVVFVPVVVATVVVVVPVAPGALATSHLEGAIPSTVAIWL
jgi:hypothetical protein